MPTTASAAGHCPEMPPALRALWRELRAQCCDRKPAQRAAEVAATGAPETYPIEGISEIEQPTDSSSALCAGASVLRSRFVPDATARRLGYGAASVRYGRSRSSTRTIPDAAGSRLRFEAARLTLNLRLCARAVAP